MENKLIYTSIQHSIRRRLKLSCNEYVLLDMVYHLQVHPSSSKKGWCYMGRNTMSKEIGMTKQGLLKIIDRMIGSGFLIKDDTTKYLKTTEKWYSEYLMVGQQSLPDTETAGQQSLPDPRPSGQQSLPDTSQQSLPNSNNINSNITDNEGMGEKYFSPTDTCPSTEVPEENLSTQSQGEAPTPTTPIAPPPSSPSPTDEIEKRAEGFRKWMRTQFEMQRCFDNPIVFEGKWKLSDEQIVGIIDDYCIKLFPHRKQKLIKVMTDMHNSTIVKKYKSANLALRKWFNTELGVKSHTELEKTPPTPTPAANAGHVPTPTGRLPITEEATIQIESFTAQMERKRLAKLERENNKPQ